MIHICLCVTLLASALVSEKAFTTVDDQNPGPPKQDPARKPAQVEAPPLPVPPDAPLRQEEDFLRTAKSLLDDANQLKAGAHRMLEHIAEARNGYEQALKEADSEVAQSRLKGYLDVNHAEENAAKQELAAKEAGCVAAIARVSYAQDSLAVGRTRLKAAEKPGKDTADAWATAEERAMKSFLKSAEMKERAAEAELKEAEAKLECAKVKLKVAKDEWQQARSKQMNKGPKVIDPRDALRIAEAFIRENGYTDFVPEDLSKLAPESFERTEKSEWPARRHQTLIARAVGYLEGGKGDSNGWTVGFSFAKSPRNLDRGRAVTMDEYGGNLVVQHKDLILSRLKPRP